MRPDSYNPYDQLGFARDRAAELRRDWQAANGPRRTSTTPDRDRAAVASLRRSAGHFLIELGQRLLPAKAEPCQ